MGEDHRPWQLQAQFGRRPITALCFAQLSGESGQDQGDDLLLVGEDTVIHVYKTDSASVATESVTPSAHARLLTIPVFSGQSIHGIRAGVDCHGARWLLVWGGRSVAVLAWSHMTESVASGTPTFSVREYAAPDWIYDGLVAPGLAATAYLLDAHNEIVPITWEAESQRSDHGQDNTLHHSCFISFQPVVRMSRPMLYSANLVWEESLGSVLVAAGTVFGEIILWRYKPGNTTSQGRCELLGVLKGHEGSIFGVHLSAELRRPGNDRPLRLLASCSDDRTVVVWDVSDITPQDVASTTLLESARETGFGTDSIQNKHAIELSPIGIGIAHISRVWHVRILSPISHKSITSSISIPIYSFGEDSTVRSWTLDVDLARRSAIEEPMSSDEAHFRLLLQNTYSNHEGKHIWSVATSAPTPKRPWYLVATGGADSTVGWVDTRPSSITKTLLLPSQTDADTAVVVNESSLSKVKKEKKPTVQQYSFFTHNELLASTSNGSLYRISLRNAEEPIWSAVDLSAVENSSQDIRACTSIAIPCSGHAIIACRTGALYSFSETKGLQLITRATDKISTMLAIEASVSSLQSPLINIVLAFFSSSELSIYQFDPQSCTILTTQVLPSVDERFLLTAAGFATDRTLVIGSRRGFLCAFDQDPQSGLFQASWQVEARSNESITSITPLPPKKGETSGLSSFLTTSRNGWYRIYTFSPSSHPSVTPSLWHESQTPLAIIESAWFHENQDTSSLELIFCGFRGPKLVVWNESTRQEVVCVDCGGAHRLFACTPSLWTGPDAFPRVAFTKASTVSIHTQLHPSSQSLRKGVHGREIRAVSANGRFLATGSEDTTVRLWTYTATATSSSSSSSCTSSLHPPHSYSLDCVACLPAHAAGLQDVSWVNDEWLITCGGSEELYLWNVRPLPCDTRFRSPGVVQVARLPACTDDGDLRILDFAVVRAPSSKTPASSTGISFSLLIALSNSEWREYQYHPDTQTFTLQSITRYTGACLTKIASLGETTQTVMTASTDGRLVVWRKDVSNDDSSGMKQYSLQSSLRVHQNSIKALSLVTRTLQVADDAQSFLIFTGGDDNSLVATSLSLSSAVDSTLSISWSRDHVPIQVPRAHTASINDLALLPQASKTSQTYRCLSISNDQRLQLWEFSADATTCEQPKWTWRLVESRYSGVADAGSLVILPQTKDAQHDLPNSVVFVGVGLEVWSIA